MNNSPRRLSGIAGIAFGLALAPLLTSPPAGADPTADAAADVAQVVTLGPVQFDGFTDTFAFNESTFAFDNFLIGTVDGSVFNLDTFYGSPGSFEILLTDPGVLQLGIDFVDGSVRYIDNFFTSDFLPADPGLALLG